MTTTAKTTTQALKKNAFGLLKEAGFDDWTARKAWRRTSSGIDTIEFRSLSSYQADVIGVPTASFTVWFGCWPVCFPDAAFPLKVGPKGPRPEEYQMPIRGHLRPDDSMTTHLATDVWRVRDIDEAEMAACAVAKQLEHFALPWMNKSWDGPALIDLLLSQKSGPTVLADGPNGGMVRLGDGNAGSPAHSRCIAELAEKSGRFELAAERYEASRYALNHLTGQHELFLEPDEDNHLKELAAKAKANAERNKA